MSEELDINFHNNCWALQGIAQSIVASSPECKRNKWAAESMCEHRYFIVIYWLIMSWRKLNYVCTVVMNCLRTNYLDINMFIS